MRNIILVLCFTLSFYACSTSKEDVFRDIESYNLSTLKLKINNCKVIDENASCANKTESYIVTCEGSSYWYKWEKMRMLTGGFRISIYTLPQGFDNYRCNPALNYKAEFKGCYKEDTKWIAENYTE